MCQTYMEDFVHELYTRMDILEPHQLSYQNISTNLGIRVLHWYESSQALFFNNQSYIFLNTYLSEEQKWQDFCHELGHVLLHAGNQKKLSKEFIRYQEEKANLFMYHACIPSFMLNHLKICDATYETIKMIRELFCVEENFAKKRLERYLNNLFYRHVVYNEQFISNWL